jgi:hypothetical protein
MKQQALSFTLAVFVIILLSGQSCNNQTGDLPYDEGNVEENIISIKTAQAYTASYRNGVTALSRTGSGYLRDSFQMPVAVQFNKDVLALLMNQKDSSGGRAEGVRLYFARDAKNQVTLVLVPYDRSNNDIINKLIKKDVAWIPGITPAFAQLVEAQAVDNALRCPTFCDQASSPLDGDLQPIPPQ